MKRFISLFLAIFFVLALSVTASARLVGDVDSDGVANATDALMILKHTVGKPVDKMNLDYADVNGDGNVNATDALIVLQITVGKYKGDLEVDEEFVTNYKAEIVDPIMKTGKFTLVTEADIDGTKGNVTFMIRDQDVCVDMVVETVNIRMLILDGKTYSVILTNAIPFVKGIYAESDETIDVNIGGSGAKLEYIKSEKVGIDGVQYICESYKHPDGTITQYYFKDGKWALMGTVSGGTTEVQKISEFKKGVDDSRFTLDGYISLDELEKLGK